MAAGDTPLGILGIEASDGAPESVAAAITEALRQRVSASKGFRLVPGRDLVEVKLVFSCTDEAPSCMAQAAKSLGATKLIFGSVKKSGPDNYLVTLKLLDATRGLVEGWAGEPFGRSQATGAALRGPVQKWFADLTGQGAVGNIRVRGDVVGASVSLDGIPAGLMGNEDLALSAVPAGKHEILVTKPGYEPVRKDVVVSNGQTAQVSIEMGAAAGTAVSTTTAARPVDLGQGAVPGSGEPAKNQGIRAATWGVLGAGALGLVLGIKFGLDVQKTNDALDPYRRYNCSDGKGLCDSQQQPARPLNAAQIAYVNDEKSQGQKFQNYQYVAYGVGAALLVTSGVLFYMGYMQEDGGRAHATGPRLRILPLAFAHGGGVLAGLRF